MDDEFILILIKININHIHVRHIGYITFMINRHHYNNKIYYLNKC